MKRVALLGGSFNPPHPGHFDMARYLSGHLPVDEVWLLFSHNWQKNPEDYAPLDYRLEMAGILRDRYYADVPVVFSDFQYRVNEHKTGDVMERLQVSYPDHRFVWVMGADALASFHTWERHDFIMTHFPIVVLARPPYTETALTSPTARAYSRNDNADDLICGDRPGWTLLDNPQLELSSSAFLGALRAGQTSFPQGFQEIADYIRTRGLYGLTERPFQPGAPMPGKRG